jgi:sigma-54 specific flagellar transcriptional regulator A
MPSFPAMVTSSTSGVKTSGLVHGPHSPLIDTKRTCLRIAASDATVLLMGETGTGKEVFARFVHGGSPRAARPFVPVNCGAIPETLLESELFGYVKGAFTGAVAARRGRVGLAEGGTLFLDEIGELPLSLQVKLLRLLQERTYEPIGSSDSVAANFRLVAATNRDLAEEVRLGRFRSDLYYRLNVCPIRLPALRERRGDILALFHSFWARRGETRPVEPAVLQCLEAYAWPGNVRELENLVERVSVCTEGDVIRVADLPLAFWAPRLDALQGDDEGGASMGAPPLQLASSGRQERASLPMVAPAASPAGVVGGADLPLGVGAGRRPDGAVAESSRATEVDVGFTSRTAGPTPVELAPAATGPGDSTSSAPSLGEMARALRARSLAAVGVDADAGPATGDATGSRELGSTPTPILQFPIDLPTMLRELENRYINAALARTGSNKKEAAKLLGMGRTTLVEKLRRRSTDQRVPVVAEES